jgi:hypothetical protein
VKAREPARAGSEAALDRKKQPGHALDLVDYRRPGDAGDEARGPDRL